jgi:hypothetical protein
MRNNETKTAVKITPFLFIIPFFILCEIIILAVHFNLVFPGSTAANWPYSGQWPAGDILFTGDTFGVIDLYGCERFGSLSRRAAVLKKFPDYLYLDFGNITAERQRVNKAAFPLLLEGLQYMGLKVLNFTKQDFIDLSEIDCQAHGIHLVSANLVIHAPETQRKLVSLYQLLPFRLKNKTQSQVITVGITGISNNERKLHRGIAVYTVGEIKQSLKKIKNDLNKADLKILLFNDTYFKLEKLLADPGIRFDLVISRSTLPDQVNTMIRINNTAVVFADEYGRSLGHVRAVKKKDGFTFEYNAYNLGIGIPEDKQIKEITKGIIKRMQNRTGLETKSKPAENKNEE